MKKNDHFSKSINVYFADTDAAGVAHHSRYIVWLEMARIDFLSHIGCPYTTFQEDKLGFVPVHIDIQYLKPFVFGDSFEVSVSIIQLNRASFVIKSQFIKDEVCHCKATQKLAAMDEAAWKVIPIPTRLTDALNNWSPIDH